MQRLRRGLLCAFVIVAAAIVLGMVFNLVVPAAGLPFLLAATLLVMFADQGRYSLERVLRGRLGRNP